MTARLLDAFRALFEGRPYRHRVSTHGDRLALELYEDLYDLGRSPKFNASVDARQYGVGPKNKSVTLQRMRRGDGTFGQIIDPAKAREFPGYRVARGALATIDIAAEVKVLNKAMIKQIDRVVNDLDKQVKNWKSVSATVITVAFIGVNYAPYTVGYEGERSFRTDGGDHKHPADEAPSAERHIITRVVERNIYDEVVMLQYCSTNDSPFSFAWVDEARTEQAYRATLVRLASKFERMF